MSSSWEDSDVDFESTGEYLEHDVPKLHEGQGLPPLPWCLTPRAPGCHLLGHYAQLISRHPKQTCVSTSEKGSVI